MSYYELDSFVGFEAVPSGGVPIVYTERFVTRVGGTSPSVVLTANPAAVEYVCGKMLLNTSARVPGAWYVTVVLDVVVMYVPLAVVFFVIAINVKLICYL